MQGLYIALNFCCTPEVRLLFLKHTSGEGQCVIRNNHLILLRRSILTIGHPMFVRLFFMKTNKLKICKLFASVKIRFGENGIHHIISPFGYQIIWDSLPEILSPLPPRAHTNEMSMTSSLTLNAKQ